jgi:hypothetical protein
MTAISKMYEAALSEFDAPELHTHDAAADPVVFSTNWHGFWRVTPQRTTKEGKEP